MPKACKDYRKPRMKRDKMPKAWQDYITTSWLKSDSLAIFYNHNNPSGFKIQTLMRTIYAAQLPFYTPMQRRQPVSSCPIKQNRFLFQIVRQPLF